MHRTVFRSNGSGRTVRENGPPYVWLFHFSEVLCILEALAWLARSPASRRKKLLTLSPGLFLFLRTIARLTLSVCLSASFLPSLHFGFMGQVRHTPDIRKVCFPPYNTAPQRDKSLYLGGFNQFRGLTDFVFGTYAKVIIAFEVGYRFVRVAWRSFSFPKHIGVYSIFLDLKTFPFSASAKVCPK